MGDSDNMIHSLDSMPDIVEQDEEVSSGQIQKEDDGHHEKREASNETDEPSSSTYLTATSGTIPSSYVTALEDDPQSVTSTIKDFSPDGSPVTPTSAEDDFEYVEEPFDKYADQRDRVEKALMDKNRSLLMSLSQRAGGFVADELRKKAWPLILHNNLVVEDHIMTEEQIENHPLNGMVKLDVERSLGRFPPSIDGASRITRMDELQKLIVRVLDHKNASYYQGFHDVCVTVLLIMGDPESAFQVMGPLVDNQLRFFVKNDITQTIKMLEMIPTILQKEDQALFHMLDISEVGTVFSLSWVITWFSHLLRNYKNVGRLFDLFVCGEETLPVYYSIAIILHHRNQILALDDDQATVHSFLTRLIENHELVIPFDELVPKAIGLMEKYPPPQILAEASNIYDDRRKKEMDKLNPPKSSCSFLRLLIPGIFFVAIKMLYPYFYRLLPLFAQRNLDIALEWVTSSLHALFPSFPAYYSACTHMVQSIFSPPTKQE